MRRKKYIMTYVQIRQLTYRVHLHLRQMMGAVSMSMRSFDEDMGDMGDDDDDDDDVILDEPEIMAAKLWMQEELLSTFEDSRDAIRIAVALYYKTTLD